MNYKKYIYIRGVIFSRNYNHNITYIFLKKMRSIVQFSFKAFIYKGFKANATKKTKEFKSSIVQGGKNARARYRKKDTGLHQQTKNG